MAKQEKGPKPEGKPDQIRAQYGHGRGVKQIMKDTGKSYADVKGALDATRTRTTTGGPHDTSKCRHNH